MRRLTERQIVEFALTRPRTDDELWNYVRVLFNISIPRKPVLPGCSAPFDAFANSFFARTPVSIWIGSRGTGKTVLLALLASVELLTLKCNISVLAGSKDQAELTLKYLRNEDTNLAGLMWGADNAPRMLMDETLESKGMVKSIPGLTGRREDPGLFIKAHAASETAIRGNHASRLRYDEVDLADWTAVESSRGVTSAIRDVDTHTLYCSTYHVYGGTMSRLLAEAREKGWPIFSWTWREVLESNDGFMSQKFIDNKRAELSAAQWELEYENAGPQGGVRVFDKHQLATMFQKRMGVHTGAENEPWKLYPDGVSGGRFYHGADWARDLHWTVVDTLQRTAAGYQRAAWYRTNQKPYPQIIREVVKHVKEYRGPICHDATGVGKAMDDLLVDAGLRRNSVFPIEWTRKKLIREMATLYQHAIENEEIVGPMINFAYSEHEYLTEEMLRGDDHCPDSVAAGMAAYYVARQMCGGRNTVVMRV